MAVVLGQVERLTKHGPEAVHPPPASLALDRRIPWTAASTLAPIRVGVSIINNNSNFIISMVILIA